MSKKTLFGTLLFELTKTFTDSEHGICQDCLQPNTDRKWCQSCNAENFRKNFSNWTSGNKHIDMFIQDAQLTAANHYEVLEWIPYDQLKKVTFIANGRYSTNSKAVWSKGDILQWDHDKNDWSRFQGSIENWSYSQDNATGLNGRIVSLKSFQDSSDICSELEKLRHYLQSLKEAIKNDNMLLPLFGITQHPKTSEYMIVTNYAEGGSLRNNLQYIRKLSWKERLEILLDIAYGLAGLHKSDLLHRNLHSDWCEYYDDNIKDIEDKNIQLPIMQFQHADKLLRAQSRHSSNFYAPYYTNIGFSSYKTYDNKKDQTRYYY
ncbi:26082_t:CDS:2 [Dentiscutata erythropus]|uniref:26082_t:CDS:1 n=1 Tax=Dentiscutata erythropus TaxID=1348616 RepID=A0A9N9CTK4_9GLOM|nr:26082_t:CDS:2 [Dentiscutata erythropus]